MREVRTDSRLKLTALTVLSAALIALATLATGCGSESTPVTPTPAGTTSTQFRIGDAPVDRILSFEITLGSTIVLTPSGGGSPVNLTVGTNRLELTHMSGKLEAVGISNVAQGTYSTVQLTINNPEMTYLNASNAVTTLLGNPTQTVTVNLNPALTIGNAPGLVNVDVNVANSITTDTAGNVTGFNFSGSSFTFSTKAVGPQTGQQEDDNGEMEDVTGLVTAVNAPNFTLKVGQTDASMDFNFDSTTQFNDGVTAGTLLNQIVSVEGFTRTDGSLFAKEVEGQEASTGSELEGMITSISGTLLTVTAHDGSGSGMDDTKVGADFTVSISWRVWAAP